MQQSIGKFLEETYDSRPHRLAGSINWVQALSNANYHAVETESINIQWKDMLLWCNEHVGVEHYTWTGTIFWFETSEVALLFVLKWL